MTDYCPHCYSRYPDIHHMVFSPGSSEGIICKDPWHKGPNYRPDRLDLTKEDVAWLQELKVKAD